MAVFSVVLVTAAPPGQGAEAGGAFVKIDGREALLRSVELFVNREQIMQIQLVVDADAMPEVKRKYGGHLSFAGVKLVSGGPEWVGQLAAAAGTLADQATHVIVHDAARPAVPYTDIEALMRSAERHDAVTLVAPTRQMLIEVDQRGAPKAYHLPERFMRMLTPQVFSRAKFSEVASTRQELPASSLVLLKGSPLNARVAGPGDERLVKAMIQMLPRPKVRGPTNPFEEAQW